MGLLHPHMEKLPSWWNDRGCFTPGHTHLAPAVAGRCFNSFWVWKSGVNDKLAPFFGQDTLSSSENTRNSLLPAQRQWEYHREKMSSDSSNVQGWKLRQDRGVQEGLNTENRGSMWRSSHISHLVVLRCSWIQRPAQKQLSYDTAQGPHVNGFTEWQTQDDLRSSAQGKGNKRPKSNLLLCKLHFFPVNHSG